MFDLVFIFCCRILFELEHDGPEPANVLDMLDTAGRLEVDVEVAKLRDSFPLCSRNYFVNWGHKVLLLLAVERLGLRQLLIIASVPEVVKIFMRFGFEYVMSTNVIYNLLLLQHFNQKMKIVASYHSVNSC